MERLTSLEHEFVEYLPADVEDGKIYVTMAYATAVHKCCCGCGHKVFTPFTPNDWKLTFDGESVSLRPSIGNWGFPCQSHYWIREGKIRWSGRMSKEEIEAGRAADLAAKRKYYSDKSTDLQPVATAVKDKPRKSLWQRITSWLR